MARGQCTCGYIAEACPMCGGWLTERSGSAAVREEIESDRQQLEALWDEQLAAFAGSERALDKISLLLAKARRGAHR